MCENVFGIDYNNTYRFRKVFTKNGLYGRI